MKRLAMIALAVAAAACGGSSTSPSVVTNATVTTDTFNGVLNPPVNGVLQSNFHTFTVNTGGGTINITLVSATPPPTIQLGLALGNPGAGSCSIIPGFTTVTAASSTAQLPASGAPAGAYCVVVGDVGNVLQPVSYTVTVAHT